MTFRFTLNTLIICIIYIVGKTGCYRCNEGNTTTDFLAKKGALSDSSLVILNEAPLDMVFVLLADAMSVEFVRS